jgi:hypothetical protein
VKQFILQGNHFTIFQCCKIGLCLRSFSKTYGSLFARINNFDVASPATHHCCDLLLDTDHLGVQLQQSYVTTEISCYYKLKEINVRMRILLAGYLACGLSRYEFTD